MKAKLIKTWNFNKISIEEGTEVNLIKGMEAGADSVFNAPYGMCYLCELNERMCYIPATYLTITDWTNIDWEKRRYEIARQMLLITSNFTELTCNGITQRRICREDAVQYAIKYADTLIAELKKGGEK